VINPVPEVKKRRQSKNRSAQEQVVLDEVSSKTPHQVHQLREALKGAGVTISVNQQARH
jgi:transposase-like protein